MDDIRFESRNLLAMTKHGCQRDTGFIANIAFANYPQFYSFFMTIQIEFNIVRQRFGYSKIDFVILCWMNKIISRSVTRHLMLFQLL